MTTPSKTVSDSVEVLAQEQQGGGESAGASGPIASAGNAAMVNEKPIIEIAPEDEQFPEGGSDSELYEESNSTVASLKFESDSESGSDSDTDSEKGVLRYLSGLDGHRRWKGADGTQTDIRDCLMRPEDIQITFDDVHITPDAIEALDPVLLQLEMPAQFKFGILAQQSSAGVLLYGPPGTGKTQFVRAFAKMANATVLSLTGADFRHHHVGESEKRIQQIFAYARDHKGSFVIFIDEADSIFRSRSLEGCSNSYANDINQFLAEMDGVKSNGLRNVMVIAASNRPFDIDEGILRRLSRRILVDVPRKHDREAILRIHLKNEELADDVNLSELAKVTGDYTGSDLRDLVHEAALVSLREMRFRVMSAMDGNSERSMATDLEREGRLLQWKHFQAARKQIRPSPKSDTVEKVREFHNKFGNTSQRPAAAPLKYHITNRNVEEEVQNRQ